MEMDPERNILLVDTPAKYQVVNVEVLGVPINYGVKMKRMVGRDLKRILCYIPLQRLKVWNLRKLKIKNNGS